MAGNFKIPNAPKKSLTSIGLGVDLVDQFGHGGLPIGHGGVGGLGAAECSVIRVGTWEELVERRGGRK